MKFKYKINSLIYKTICKYGYCDYKGYRITYNENGFEATSQQNMGFGKSPLQALQDAQLTKA